MQRRSETTRKARASEMSRDTFQPEICSVSRRLSLAPVMREARAAFDLYTRGYPIAAATRADTNLILAAAGITDGCADTDSPVWAALDAHGRGYAEWKDISAFITAVRSPQASDGRFSAAVRSVGGLRVSDSARAYAAPRDRGSPDRATLEPSATLSPRESDRVFRRQVAWKEAKERRAEVARREKAARELALLRPSPTSASPGAAAERLYRHGVERSARVPEPAQLSPEHTFSPQILRRPRSPDLPDPARRPRGFDSAVQRLQHGGALRRENRERFERLGEPRERGREHTGGTATEPFVLSTQQRAEERRARKPVLFIDVEVGTGRLGRIGVFRGDNLRHLAESFARAYSLDAAAVDQLERLVRRQVMKVAPRFEEGA